MMKAFAALVIAAHTITPPTPNKPLSELLDVPGTGQSYLYDGECDVYQEKCKNDQADQDL